MTRRDFIKGILGAAAYLSIPKEPLLASLHDADVKGYDFWYVTPREYVAYEKALDANQMFVHNSFGGFQHLMFKGKPLMPFAGEMVDLKNGIPLRECRGYERFRALIDEKNGD
jgi:hypothetical protein